MSSSDHDISKIDLSALNNDDSGVSTLNDSVDKMLNDSVDTRKRKDSSSDDDFLDIATDKDFLALTAGDSNV